MLRFLTRRLLLGLLVLWIVSVAVFVLFFVTPHDPARLIAGRLATPQTVALVNHRLGLDRPLVDEYGGFVGGPSTATWATPTTAPRRCGSCWPAGCR